MVRLLRLLRRRRHLHRRRLLRLHRRMRRLLDGQHGRRGLDRLRRHDCILFSFLLCLAQQLDHVPVLLAVGAAAVAQRGLDAPRVGALLGVELGLDLAPRASGKQALDEREVCAELRQRAVEEPRVGGAPPLRLGAVAVCRAVELCSAFLHASKCAASCGRGIAARGRSHRQALLIHHDAAVDHLHLRRQAAQRRKLPATASARSRQRQHSASLAARGSAGSCVASVARHALAARCRSARLLLGSCPAADQVAKGEPSRGRLGRAGGAGRGRRRLRRAGGAIRRGRGLARGRRGRRQCRCRCSALRGRRRDSARRRRRCHGPRLRRRGQRGDVQRRRSGCGSG